jgi:hypothetical protein
MTSDPLPVSADTPAAPPVDIPSSAPAVYPTTCRRGSTDCLISSGPCGDCLRAAASKCSCFRIHARTDRSVVCSRQNAYHPTAGVQLPVGIWVYATGEHTLLLKTYRTTVHYSKNWKF